MSRQRKKDEARAAARARRQEQAQRTRDQAPVMAGGFAIENTSDNRILAKAVRQRWAIPEKVFQAVPEAMQKILDKGSERNRIMAAKTLAVIHGQNEAAEIEEQKRTQPQQQPTPVNVNVGVQVSIHESDDWYGARPHNERHESNGHVAAGDGPPAADLVIAGAVQSGGVRPAVGQNGVGTNGHSKGPRELPGPATGSS